MVVLSLDRKTHIRYIQYVDNDVYVDDVDVDGQAFLYCRPMDGSFAECSAEDKPDDCMPTATRVSVEDKPVY